MAEWPKMEAACRYYGEDQADRSLSFLSACLLSELPLFRSAIFELSCKLVNIMIVYAYKYILLSLAMRF